MPISSSNYFFSDIRNEFNGGSNPIYLSDYYNKLGKYSYNLSCNIPSSNTIYLGNFSNTSKNNNIYVTGTVNSINTTSDTSKDIYAYFTNSGTLTVNSNTICDILLVGGGGGGGSSTNTSGNISFAGGGGGGGDVIYLSSYILTSNVYNINVGSGGIAQAGSGGLNGQISSITYTSNNIFFGLYAAGGGGGGSPVPLTNANNGVSIGTINVNYSSGGGGGAAYNTLSGLGNSVSGNGSIYDVNNGYAGGGGGAVGNASSITGGSGYTSSITGTNITYGNGGGGGDDNIPGTGDPINPGTVIIIYDTTYNALNNTGNGGNGGDAYSYGGSGGSGVVIIRFRTYNTIVTNINNSNIITGIVTNNNNFKYAIFNNSGSFTLLNNTICDIFMIGGGGGGGYNIAGGGGAGAYYYGTNLTLNSGTYNITVGNGGNGGTSATSPQNGGDTIINYNGSTFIINSLSAICKGGGGAGMYNISIGVGQNGGCGGGGDGWSEIQATNSVISGGATNNTGTIGTGFAGGSGRQFYTLQQLAGGGGGGISSTGFSASGKEGGNGGSGLVINITGEENVYGGGGGANEWPANSLPPAGLGGGATLTNGTFVKIGGDGQRTETQNGGDAIINTGSGGGGGKGARGGNGSSGVFIIRYNINSNIIFNNNNIVTGTSNIINSVVNNTNYNYILFKNSGTLIMKNNLYCEVLLVGGGGGGGRQINVSGSGGGGGGGVGIGKIMFKSGLIYNITIGNGGAGSTTLSSGNNGGNTSIIGDVINETAYGGGGGGSTIGLNGGSGGGASAPLTTQIGGISTKGVSLSGSNNAIITYFGNNGGNSIFSTNLVRGGGGGGAANIGEISGNSYGGNGGDGILSSITGIDTYYGAGGGGGSGIGGGGIGLGGLGGGGNGGTKIISTTDGISNSGSGGGGGGGNTTSAISSIGGNGGSGVVIIKYPIYYPIITGNNNVINTTFDNNNFSYAFFANSGTLSINKNLSCDILVVGGGGAGTTQIGGAGGGGAVVYIRNAYIASGTYNIVVGLGGQTSATKGNNSSFGSIIAEGGGAGGTFGDNLSGGIGGSGGGAGCDGTDGEPHNYGGAIGTASSLNGFTGTIYGNIGGEALARSGGLLASGGGGGAGQVGGNGNIALNCQGGAGGNGIQINIDGRNYYWGGGGGGSSYFNGNNRGGNGGLGGGGGGSPGNGSGIAGIGGGSALNIGQNASTVTLKGGDGGVNTGGGGGGGGWDSGGGVWGLGGLGGSGVVIIRFPNVEPFNIQYDTSNLYIKSNSVCVFNDLSNINIPANSNYNINFNNGNVGIGEMPYARPWGAYFASDWSGTTLPDISGNGRHAITTGTITSNTLSGNGSTAAISSISGNTTATITWPIGSIPTTFTILSLTRYTGPNYRRILSSKTGNWFHGHSSNARGDAYYEGWKTTTANKGTLTDWLCFIGKNSGSTPNNILADGTGIGTATGGSGNNYQMAINNISYTGETSDWSLSCAVIYDSILTDAHMTKLNNFINSYKSTGDVNTLKSNILRFTNNNNPYVILKDANGNNINPTAWYKFDNSTNLGLDTMGAYTFTNYNSVAYNSNICKKGSGSAFFNSATSSYLLGTGVNINNISFSISFWAYPTPISTDHWIYAKDNNQSVRQALYIGYYNSGNNFYFGFYGDDLGIYVYNHLYKWNFMVCTYNVSNNQRNIYSNGVLAGSNTSGGALNAPNQTYNIGRIFNATGYFNGYLDDFRIYANLVMTPKQVLDLYNGTIQIYQ